ncbi:MAG TPA: HD domain-containing protein [Haploplasma sp.]|nr:HD domain-containing protein [Haploplasma sp.]
MIKDLFNQLSKYPMRLLHVMQVANVSKSLALNYGLNGDDAYLAGLLHDYAKYETIDFYVNYLTKEERTLYINDQVNYHAIGAANYFSSKYYINEVVYDAIYYHVFGKPNMDDITKIVFIADSVYLNGKYNSRYIYEVALRNLDEAVVIALEMTFKHLEIKNLLPNKFQIETYNFYKEVMKNE